MRHALFSMVRYATSSLRRSPEQIQDNQYRCTSHCQCPAYFMYMLTLKQLDDFSQSNSIGSCYFVCIKYFCVKLALYNEYSFDTMDTDGLVISYQGMDTMLSTHLWVSSYWRLNKKRYIFTKKLIRTFWMYIFRILKTFVPGTKQWDIADNR